MLVLGETGGKQISEFSSQFQSEFVGLLSRRSVQFSPLYRNAHFPDALRNRWGTKRVRTNQVYQEYIADKAHLHMNATRWLSLTEFTKHLGRTGVAHVDETEKGWFITWIDNSPKALAKSEANQKKERGDIDDETRQRRLIEEQIARARREGERRKTEAAGGIWDGEVDEIPQVEESSGELVRAEGEKVSLNLSFKIKTGSPPPSLPSPPASLSPPSTTTVKVEDSDAVLPTESPAVFFKSNITSTLSLKPTATAFKPTSLLKPNPLKRVNPLKAIKSTSSSSNGPMPSSASGPGASAGAQKRTMSNVEAIVQEEMNRKKRVGDGSDPWAGIGNSGGIKRPKYEFRG